ncbi:hypothetical protein [Lysobacter gummosus]|uniref:hypothetical protein n=1 Tax=Lysobacter gummosus TaxID=262324 RepID=UPI00363D3BA4
MGACSKALEKQSVIPAKAGSALLRRSQTSRDFSAILQAVIPAKAGIQRLQRDSSRPSFPRTRAPLYFGGAKHPETSAPSSKPSFPRTRESSDFKRSRTKGPGCSAPPK